MVRDRFNESNSSSVAPPRRLENHYPKTENILQFTTGDPKWSGIIGDLTDCQETCYKRARIAPSTALGLRSDVACTG
jgi:hypothetical protein